MSLVMLVHLIVYRIYTNAIYAQSLTLSEETAHSTVYHQQLSQLSVNIQANGLFKFS